MLTLTLNAVAHFFAPDAYGDLTLWRGTPEDHDPIAVTDERTCDPNLWAYLTGQAKRHTEVGAMLAEPTEWPCCGVSTLDFCQC
jgi:hypothetical protein